MISGENAGFPNIIVDALADRFATIDPEVPVYKRVVQQGDPIQCWTVVPAIWSPADETWETGRPQLMGPTVQRYTLGIQCFNQDMDQERGGAIATRMAGIARNLLSRDPTVRVALASLSSTEFGFTERYRRSSLQATRFLSNEIEGYFLHLSNLEFLVETEIMQ